MQQKIIFLIWISFLSIGSGFALPYPNSTNAHLSGKVTDKTTGESLPGVSIYFPDLKNGTATKDDGSYFIDKLPATKLLIQVSYLGYKIQSRQLDLAKIQTADFELELSATEIGEVVVTGQSSGIENNRTPSPIAVVPRAQMLQNSSSNIIDALSKVPGVSQVTTGAGSRNQLFAEWAITA